MNIIRDNRLNRLIKDQNGIIEQQRKIMEVQSLIIEQQKQEILNLKEQQNPNRPQTKVYWT